jgi:hydroxypyruvate isomerase
MLQFSANLSMLFTEVPLIERFALARQHGFDAIEIQFPYELSIEQIQIKLNQHQLKLILINIPAGDLMHGGDGLAGIPRREQTFRQAVYDALEYAKALNVPNVNVLAGRQPVAVDLLPCLHVLAANLRFAMDVMAASNIGVVLEGINGIDMPRFLIQNIVQMQEMLEAVNTRNIHHPLKMQFDCYHMAMMGEDLFSGLTENIHQIGHIQFADCPHRQEPRLAPVTEEQIDYKNVFSLIRALDYYGYCGAEYRPSTNTGLTLDWMSWGV